MNPPATRHPPRPEAPDGQAWLGLCVLLGAASLLAWWFTDQRVLAWDAHTWTREPWVLWSASLVHLSGAHLVANLLALGLLAGLGTFLRAGRRVVVALLFAWPLGTLALLYWPQITGYSGMSGLLNSMVAVLWAHALVHAAKPLSFIIFAALAIKLLGEHAWSQPIAFDPNWGFNVVYAAHLGGALSGALWGLLVQAPALLNKRAN